MTVDARRDHTGELAARGRNEIRRVGRAACRPRIWPMPSPPAGVAALRA
jgi:hypothetical protein